MATPRLASLVVGSLATMASLLGATPARAHDDACGDRCAVSRCGGSCRPSCDRCASRCAPRVRSWCGYRAYTPYRSVGCYGNWGGIRGEYADACNDARDDSYNEVPACAPLRCRYRFYRGACWSRAVLGRGYFPWPSVVRLADASSDDDATLAQPLASAVPLGSRATAHDAMFRGDFEAAESAWRVLATSDEADAAAWIGLLHADFALHRYDEAASALRKAASLGALSLDQRLDVEGAYGDATKFHELLGALEARVHFRFTDANARLVLAYFEAGLGKSADAREDLEGVLRRSTGDACALALLGRPAPSAGTLVASR